MLSKQRQAIPEVVFQHLEDAAGLRSLRSVQIRASHIRLRHLERTDERLLAHLDGLRVSGNCGAELSLAALATPGVGQLFVNTVLAIERRDTPQISRLLALLGVNPHAARALASGFGWVSPSLLRGLTGPLLASPLPDARWLGIAACAQHRVDPGSALAAAIEQPHPGPRARALRAAGELGRLDLLPLCLALLQDEAPAIALAAAWSATLLGGQTQAAMTLRAIASKPGATQPEALALALLTSDAQAARTLVKQLAANGAALRILIKAAGWAGDAQVVPWLFKHMENDLHARLAGEAFSFITGADLALLDLQRKPPQNAVAGPSDDPADDDVALDEDDGLPWPDLPKLRVWWHESAEQFPQGTRLFAGAVPSINHCFKVLKEDTQRRRTAAALYLNHFTPGSVLFNCASPAHRQQHLLMQMEV